jgi:hypothetical protein
MENNQSPEKEEQQSAAPGPDRLKELHAYIADVGRAAEEKIMETFMKDERMSPAELVFVTQGVAGSLVASVLTNLVAHETVKEAYITEGSALAGFDHFFKKTYVLMMEHRRQSAAPPPAPETT